ncbi:MAG: hypothetical protein GXP55_11240 [Deltaproteobacteria bacterium]|nr:hypothetical protein [Deltaproteobacteria bacterium]
MERVVLWHRALPAGYGQVPDELSHHVDALSARLREAGGELLGSLGAAVVASFAARDLEIAVELALAESAEAERSEDAPRISFGLSLGLIEARPEGGMLGDCIDRAQLLANRARAYELLLDAPARQRAAGHFLFSRVVGTGSAAARGYAVDRKHPHRHEARRGLAHLGCMPVAKVVGDSLAPQLEAELKAPRLLITRGPEGAGLEAVLRRHLADADYAFVLCLRGTPGGLEPLGSLKRALARAEVAAHAKGTAADPRGAMRECLEAETQSREATLACWSTLLNAAGSRGGALVTLGLHQAVDVASVELVGVGLTGDAPHRVVAELPLDAPMPRALGVEGEEVLLPPLRTRDARLLAGGILKLDPGGDLARRVAVLGGDTPMGVEEAARTLVAAGDLLHRGPEAGEEWRWRVAPRGGVCAIPVEALLEERVEALRDDARRLLDVLAAAPLETRPDTLMQLTQRDGMSPEAVEGALEELTSEALLIEGTRMSQTLREHLLLAMPPARVAELRRYLAQVLDERGPDCSFERATLGYLWAEGGDPQRAATQLLQAAQAAHSAGWTRAAVRLAAIAVQTSPTAETRRVALAITRGRSSPARADAPSRENVARPEGTQPAGSETQPEPSEEQAPTARAVRALLSGDFETVDGFIDLAVAEGHDLAATDRLRAMAHLLRSDMTSARRLLDRAKNRGGDDPRQQARAALALAWVQLRGGLPQDAIRDGLHALALARSLQDPRGEAAAMHTLAACYRKLGRGEQAARIEEASPT